MPPPRLTLELPLPVGYSFSMILTKDLTRRCTAAAFSPWALAVAAALLPTVLMFANRATVALLAVVSLAVVADRLRGIPARPCWDRRFLVVLAAFLLYGAASAMWEYTHGLALGKFGQLFGLVAGGIIICSWAPVPNDAERRRIFMAAVAGLLVYSALVVFEGATNLAIATTQYRMAHGGEPASGMVVIQRYKTSAAVGAILALGVIGHAVATRQWLVAVLVAVAELTTAALTGSLSGLAAMGMGGAVAAFAVIRRTLPANMLRMALIAAFVLAPAALWMPAPHSLVVAVPWIPNSAVHRTAIWHFAAERIAERPILGWGLDAAREIPGGNGTVETWIRNGGPEPMMLMQQAMPLHPHNFVLQIWLETGAVGAALFLAMLFGVVRLASRLTGGYDLVAVAVVAASVVVGGVSFGIWQSWWLASLWLVAAFVCALSPSRPAG